jgi:hypothetical protein
MVTGVALDVGHRKELHIQPIGTRRVNEIGAKQILIGQRVLERGKWKLEDSYCQQEPSPKKEVW